MVQPRVTFARQVSWPFALVNLTVLAAFIALAWVTTKRSLPAVLWGSASFIVWSQLTRSYVLRFHTAGIRELRARRFAEALASFQQSLDYLSSHRWLDRYRAVTFLSSSAIPYREMAMANIGYCLIQLDRMPEARRAYERLKAEYPDSGLYEGVLKLFAAKSAT